MVNDVFLISKFPDFNAPGFDMAAYNRNFMQSNIIINAHSADVSYAEHWGCLSVKCAFGGNEVYEIADRYYAVNDSSYFICNEGEYYSSYISAKQPVESFTLNFSNDFTRRFAESLLAPGERLIDAPDFISNRPQEFVQKLYGHGGQLSVDIFGLKQLVNNFHENRERITEQYHAILTNLFLSQQHIAGEIKQVAAVKLSTQKELYKRLHYAKDYIESCYAEDVTLDKLALVSCLNSAYLLRQFKKYFRLTPYQYLIKKRMAIAEGLILNTTLPITEICFSVGYCDTSSFCKLFKKYYRYSPENYRDVYKKVSFRPSAAF